MVNLFCVNWGAWNAIVSTITCCVAASAAIIAYFQYKSSSEHQKEATRSRILADYNRFYASNNSIKLVIKAIINRNYNEVHPYDLEIFLRFYEEIFLLVHTKNRMKGEIAKYMFSFYAIAAWDDDRFWDKLIDEEHPTIDSVKTAEEWTLYRKFVEEMKTININNIKI